MERNSFVIFFLLCLTMVGTVRAQQNTEIKQEINRIKKSSFYLYGETTMPDKEEALQTAIDILQNEAQKWAQAKRKKNEVDSNLILTNIEQVSSKVELPRGNMYRAFVYVKKADVLISKNAVVMGLKKDTLQEIISEPKQELKSTVEVIDAGRKEHENKADTQPEVINKLLALQKFDEIKTCVEALKRDGDITDYNKYAALSNPEDYILIIYNRSAEVEAILGTGKERINLKTNQPDGIANYKGRGAIGVRLSNSSFAS